VPETWIILSENLDRRRPSLSDRFLTGLILNLGKGNRGYIRAGDLILTQNLDPPRSDFDDQSAIWTDPRLLTAGHLNRIATGSVDRERVPVFGSQ
jgi:hypothetical protein